ncbi:hypothetical protein K239x_11570 [Planctomycetes bacterium K23_9]|uniref:DUF4347 domain-containing protein n=2 Tax=Stieleria marina TaxID=1930275 RepID=A0A517NQ14_9BACT|nr:hypothetical protein K239x_11570 [Planctomycetes bacterium K23_9]
MLAADAGVQVAATQVAGAQVGGEASAPVGELRLQDASPSIVFVDSSLDDVDTLLAGVADPSAEIILLSPDADGVAQISRVLSGRSDVRSIHLVTHGSDGVVQLGSTQLDAQTLRHRGDQIVAWRNSLAADADILLYGCNVAAGASGKALVAQLAQLTGADVASSDDVTGSPLNGADWDLEHRLGDIETALAFQAAPLQRFQGLLISNVQSQTIEIYAAGQTGEENLDIFIDQNYVTTFYGVGGNVGQRQFERFVYETDSPVSADQVSVAFGNDLYVPAVGIDRNLVVDRMVLGGVAFETEDPATFSTGIWRDGLTGPGNYETETLNINSIFTYSSDSDSQPAGQISVEARGDNGDEVLQIHVDGSLRGEFEVDTSLNTYFVAVENGVTADRVQIVFANDFYDPDNGIDRNLIVQSYDVNGTQFDPASENVFSNGTFLAVDGITDGYGRGNTLHTNGYFQAGDQGPLSQGTLIRFFAKGSTSEQTVRVTTRSGELVKGVVVDQGVSTRFLPIFREFVIYTQKDLALEDLRLEFIDDGQVDEFGRDREVQFSGIVVEDLDSDRVQRSSVLDNQTFATGVFSEEDGVQSGFGLGDTLVDSGYFEFQESSRIVFSVYGGGGAMYDVFIRGEKRATFTADEERVLDIDDAVTDRDVRIEFINDGVDESGVDRNLRLSSITIDGRLHSVTPKTVVASEPQDPLPSSLVLYENGFAQFGIEDPGSIRILNENGGGLGAGLLPPARGTTFASEGSYTFGIRRDGERDGVVQLQWTVRESQPGVIPVAVSSGTVSMRDDQRFTEFTVPFENTTSTGTLEVDLVSLTPGVNLIAGLAIIQVQ